MRILVISNLCPPDYDGGFELSAFRNAKSLREKGHDVDLVCGLFRNSYQGERVDAPWVHRIFKIAQNKDGWSSAEMFLGGQSDLRFNLGNLFSQIGLRLSNIQGLMKMLDLAPGNESALDQYLEGKEYDVAYVFGIHRIGTSVIQSLMKKGIPVLYHQGDEWLAYYLHPGRLKKLVLNLASPLTFSRERKIDTNHICLVSEFMKQRFVDAGMDESQLSVIHRGVEFPLRKDLDRERFFPPVFLVASRLTLYKGIHFAIKAVAILDRKQPKSEWELWIAGHGDPMTVQYFHNLVEELGVEHRVKFVGKHSRESTFALMQRSVAVISPSVFDEPFGNTNIEAMASGTPLIASRSGAIEEIIEHGKSGLIYDRTKADELATQMQLILTNKDLAHSLRVEGLKRVAKCFTQVKIIDQVEAKLGEIAGIKISMPMKVKKAERKEVSLQ